MTGDEIDRGGAYGVKRCVAPVLLFNACHLSLVICHLPLVTCHLSPVGSDEIDGGGAYGVKLCVAPVLLVNACHRDNVPLEFAFLLITAQS